MISQIDIINGLMSNTILQFVNDKYDNVCNTHYEIEQQSGKTTKKIDIGTDNTDYPTAINY